MDRNSLMIELRKLCKARNTLLIQIANTDGAIRLLERLIQSDDEKSLDRINDDKEGS